MSRSSAFKNMYRSVVGHMRGVDVGKIKGSLCYLTNPQCPRQLCVPPRVYRNATTTKELLDRLCPTYVNPEDTFVLEEIVNEFGSRRCKKELKDYTDVYVCHFLDNVHEWTGDAVSYIMLPLFIFIFTRFHIFL